jgi:cytochrome o ubiquinol oxidase subunit 2
MKDVMAHDGHAMGAAAPSPRNAPPPHGAPEGALLKAPHEMAPGPNMTMPMTPGTPGTTAPASPKNRDMSFLILPSGPAAPGLARG